MDEEQAVQAFGALASRDRIRVLRQLIAAGTAGMSAGAIAEGIGASPSRASFHLAAMTAGGLVSASRVSRQVIYRANLQTLGGILQFLLEDCCRNDPQMRRCCGFGSD